jgi:hypothetical protein
MSLAALPLTIIPLVLYNVLTLMGINFAEAGGGSLIGGGIVMRTSGATFDFSWGDLLILIAMVVLFIEIVKATYTGTASMIDHGLSMIVFIVYLVEFLMVANAGTSVFFLLMMACLIDVIAGFTIGIRVAKRDIGFGGGDN